MIHDNAFRLIGLVLGTTPSDSSSSSSSSINNQHPFTPIIRHFLPPGSRSAYTEQRQMENQAPPRRVPPVNFGCVETGVFRSAEPTSANFPFLAKIRLRNIIWLSPEEPNEAFQAFAREHNIPMHKVCISSPPPTTATPHSLPTTLSTSSSSSSATTTSTTTNSTDITGSSNSINGTDSASSSNNNNNNNNNNININDINTTTTATATTSNKVTSITVNNEPLTLPNIIAALQFLVNTTHYPVLICSRGGKYRTGAVVACLRRLQCWNLPSALAEYRRFTRVTLAANSGLVVGNERLVASFIRASVDVPPVGDRNRPVFMLVFPGM